MGKFKDLTLNELEQSRVEFFYFMFNLNCEERKAWGDTPYKDLNAYVRVVGVDFLMNEWIAFKFTDPS